MVMPAVNQLEVHPGYSQEAVTAYCKSKNICVQARSPLGRSNVLQHPILCDMAAKYQKSVAQDMWQKEHPDFAIPKAKSNFEQ